MLEKVLLEQIDLRDWTCTTKIWLRVSTRETAWTPLATHAVKHCEQHSSPKMT